MSYHYVNAQELYDDIADHQRGLAYQIAKDYHASVYDQKRHGWETIPDHNPPQCPYCGLYMSHRENAEQGSCNSCFGGAYSP